MTETTESLFDQGLERYKAGESTETLIPVFQEVCDRAPKSSPAWTCLAWLYLLEDKGSLACKAAQKAVRLAPKDPQARINLALALLATGKKGVRDHIEAAGQVLMMSDEVRKEVKQSLEDGLSRRPDWKELARVQKWLFEA